MMKKEKKMNGKILPYKSGSESAKALSGKLGFKRVKHEGNPIIIKDSLINWGCSSYPDRLIFSPDCKVYNEANAIMNASNKLQAFKLLEGNAPIPSFTENPVEASKWFKEGFVVCRTVLNGHSGKGIVISEEEKDLVESPLYVKYVPKEQEYRIHVFQEEVFFVQRKARSREVPDENVNWKVRNHANGFIYANKNIEIPELFKEISVKAIKALKLDFGAVDLIVTKKGEPYVLEVNTAPGLQGLTLQKYAEEFRKLLL